MTGGAGFVGRETVHALRVAHPKWTLIVADICPATKLPDQLRDVEYIQYDVRDARACVDAVRQARPTLIIHSAGVVPQGLARYSQRGRREIFALNVGGTENMLRAAKECGIGSFLFTGSCTSITDDLNHDFYNFTEETPFPTKSLIYGESKVVPTLTKRCTVASL